MNVGDGKTYVVQAEDVIVASKVQLIELVPKGLTAAALLEFHIKFLIMGKMPFDKD